MECSSMSKKTKERMNLDLIRFKHNTRTNKVIKSPMRTLTSKNIWIDGLLIYPSTY